MGKPLAKQTIKIMNFLRKHPDMRAPDVAQKFNIHVSRVYQLRRRIKDEEMGISSWTVTTTDTGDMIAAMDPTPGPTPEHEAEARASSAILDAKRTQKELEERLNKYFPARVDKILDERAKDYGKFIEGAEIMQMLKRMVHNYVDVRGTQLAFDQREAIDMIIHKLGRIINGNPDKADSWRDVAGYATLVADRLEGNVR